MPEESASRNTGRWRSCGAGQHSHLGHEHYVSNIQDGVQRLAPLPL